MTTIETDEDQDEGEIIEAAKSRVLTDSRVASLRKPVKTFSELPRLLDSAWSGLLVLKKNSFRTKFYLLAGSDSFATSQLTTKPVASLQINQRIRVDSNKIEDMEKNLLNSPVPGAATTPLSNILPDTYSVLLALPNAEIGKFLLNYFMHKLK